MRCKNRASLTPVTLTAAGPLRRCPSIGTAAATFTPVIQTAAGSVSRRPDASQPRLSQLALAAVAVPRGRRAVTVTAHDSFRTRPGPQRRRGHPDSESGRAPTRNWKPPVGRLHWAAPCGTRGSVQILRELEVPSQVCWSCSTYSESEAGWATGLRSSDCANSDSENRRPAGARWIRPSGSWICHCNLTSWGGRTQKSNHP